LQNAKKSAEDRGEKGREDAGMFEITKEDLIKKFEEQNGKCWYSGIELQTDKRVWKVSLERKDPSLGYTYDNTVLCCREFNGRCQWSPHEIRGLVYQVLMEEQDRDHVELETFDIVPKEKKEDNHATPREAMQQLVGSAHARTKNWKEKNDPRGGDKDFELSFDVLKTLYNDQKGRCAYSGLPFDYGTKHRKPSLERKDPLKPYTKENVCLIWMVWNTQETIAYTKYDINPDDRQSWSKEKFEYAFEHILAKVKKEFEDAHGGAAMTMDEFKTRFIAEYESTPSKS
jgi:hypothetical protein